MELPDYFRDFPEEPQELSASNAIARMIDGLGFRLYWSLEGLRVSDCSFRPSPDAHSIHEIIWHILGLVNWVYKNVFGHEMNRPENIIEQGYETLLALEKMRKHFIGISDEQLKDYSLEGRSFWSFINMPLADAIHHGGELRILRRAAGNPTNIKL